LDAVGGRPPRRWSTFRSPSSTRPPSGLHAVRLSVSTAPASCPRIWRLGSQALAFPAFVVDHAAKRQAMGPAAPLQLWLVQELLREADAKIGDGHHGLGNTEDPPELVIVEDANRSEERRVGKECR